MFKRKKLFLAFEGIEASGKSYQIKKLLKKIKLLKYKVISTREPGGSRSAEIIRKTILRGKNKNFNKLTDTFLYLASRNEHVIDKIKPALLKKKIIICDRFTDSTLAYQVYGKGVNKNLVDTVHRFILKDLKPDLTFVLKVNISKAIKRLNKRKKKNRYDKFSKSFYIKAQNAFLKLSTKNKKRYIVLDNSSDNNKIDKIIFEKFIRLYKK